MGAIFDGGRLLSEAHLVASKEVVESEVAIDTTPPLFFLAPLRLSSAAFSPHDMDSL